MKAKVKVVKRMTPRHIESEINAILTQLEPEQIRNVSVTQLSDHDYTALILYVK